MTQTTPGPDGRLVLTPVQLVDHLAAPMPPPRVHRHRYCGVLARMPAPGRLRGTPERPDLAALVLIVDGRSSTLTSHRALRKPDAQRIKLTRRAAPTLAKLKPRTGPSG